MCTECRHSNGFMQNWMCGGRVNEIKREKFTNDWKYAKCKRFLLKGVCVAGHRHWSLLRTSVLHCCCLCYICAVNKLSNWEELKWIHQLFHRIRIYFLVFMIAFYRWPFIYLFFSCSIMPMSSMHRQISHIFFSSLHFIYSLSSLQIV